MIRKAIFPVAGFGTRFLPATKASPKEMLPIVDKPLIQYAVEEAISAGITELIFVTSGSKRSIEDHFDRNLDLEYFLSSRDQIKQLDVVKNIIPANVSCVYLRQSEPLGLGHAVLCAKNIIGDEPFVVSLADDLIDSSIPCLKQMIGLVDKSPELLDANIVAIEEIKDEDCFRYGIVGLDDYDKNLSIINSIVEKPRLGEAPSNLAVVGRYILLPKIFEILGAMTPGKDKEIQLTDALSKLQEFSSVYGYRFDGKRFDCGKKLDYLKAVVQFGKKHHELGPKFKLYLNENHNY